MAGRGLGSTKKYLVAVKGQTPAVLYPPHPPPPVFGSGFPGVKADSLVVALMEGLAGVELGF
jgi:hypothetical protein